MVKRELREEARRLRREEGRAVTEIAKMLGVSKGSVSIWVRDIELTPEQEARLKARKVHWGAQNKGAKTNRRRALEKRKKHQEEGRAVARERRPLHMMACMLYWAEGAKHRNKLYFVNSDPNMMRIWLRFLREELQVDEAEIKLFIHCHRAEDIERIESYWIDLLGLPATCLRKTQVKKGSDTRRNILENGVCGINVQRTDLAMHVFGAIQEYGEFENPEWLF